MRAEDSLDWTTYLEELEQKAIRLRPRPSTRAAAAPRISVTHLLHRALAAVMRVARTAVDSPRARG
jgi:hypothetical protein